MQFIPAGEAHPAMHFAGGRTVVPVEFFPPPVKMVLSVPFCLVEQRIDDLSGSGGIVELRSAQTEGPLLPPVRSALGQSAFGSQQPSHTSIIGDFIERSIPV